MPTTIPPAPTEQDLGTLSLEYHPDPQSPNIEPYDATTETEPGLGSLENTDVAAAPKKHHIKENLTLAFGSLGVIYGDLGTSPLYVYSTIFAEYTPDNDDLYGAMSCIFWLFTIVVIFKYAIIVLSLGPFKKEGGQIAIYIKLIKYLRIKKFKRITCVTEEDYTDLETYVNETTNMDKKDLEAQFNRSSLSTQHTRSSSHHDEGVISLETASMRSKMFYYSSTFIHKLLSPGLTFACFLGCSLVLSDGLLTPTTSVLSAVSGISVPVPSLTKYVMPISVIILVILFILQRLGSGKVSFIFAPIIFVWLITIFVIGVVNIAKHDPSVFRSLNPVLAVKFLRKRSVFALGSVLLCVTGCEAMFADVGHFNQISIQLTLIAFVYPCLIICYLGQTAYLKEHRDPETVANIFYASIIGGNKDSNGFYWFVFIFATFATIIASQALILSVFSILKQLIKLKYFPNFKVVSMSKKHKGQIYIPLANFILMIAVCLTTVGFRTSNNVTAAYGMGISIDFCVTTALITFCIIYIYNKNIFWAALFFLVFGSLDTTLMVANAKKIPKGAWFPLVVSFVSVCFLYWYNHYTGKKERQLQDFLWDQYHNAGKETHTQDKGNAAVKIIDNTTIDDRIYTWTEKKSPAVGKVLKFLL